MAARIRGQLALCHHYRRSDVCVTTMARVRRLYVHRLQEAMIAPSLHMRSGHVHRIDADAISHDFDFLPGRWNVRNRRLVKPLSGGGEWIEFSGSSVVSPVWDGR